MNWTNISTRVAYMIATPTPIPTPTPTELPEWMQGCTADAVGEALDSLNYAFQDFDDASVLLLNAWKASNYSANSSAVITALSQVTEKRRAIERLGIPECIEQAKFSLMGYVNSVEGDLRQCILDDDCTAVESEDSAIIFYDFQDWYKYGRCVQNWPPPSRHCDEDGALAYMTFYDPDGSIHLSPSEQATVDAILNPIRTEVAQTAQP